MTVALWRTFWRSFFLQTLWNFERMQNVGFAFSMGPLLRRARKTKAEYAKALRRHLQFFNVHPYFAPIVMGVVYHREKQDDRPSEDGTLTALKDSMGAAFGGIGDHVIWGTWRPFCALLAMAVGLLVAYPDLAGTNRNVFETTAAKTCAKWWVAGFLTVFNSVHLWLRWRGLKIAAVEGPQVVKWVQSLRLQAWAAQIRRLGLLLLAVMTMMYLSLWTSSQILLWMVAVLLGAMVLKRWALSGLSIFYLVCATSVAMTYMGIHWP